ncbi:unnamed protein product [Didymodactylos carnosus]|uniref:Trafficking protein particle complex subunit 8 n=1 Tax=Didymodactylos carnosus TaxID=1234261 RepID=A0A813X1T5_9BILA|nr:unnamed protein product [Didymodactylos carnosus]CAF0862000.1 unnamed protein product [Didymodactylos carnosus]CAF3514067.1 unnamed protein product [Didymodactylos carnosus]CAF3649658.1 unnamed protein product [Didymodactylos carnosus]
MVVSTSHLDPMDAFHKLVQQQQLHQQQSPAKLPRWFSQNIYKYFVLIHDVTEGEESNITLRKAVSVFGDLKQHYGAGNCHLLQINSKRNQPQSMSNVNDPADSNMTDPWRLYVKTNETFQQQNRLSATTSDVNYYGQHETVNNSSPQSYSPFVLRKQGSAISLPSVVNSSSLSIENSSYTDSTSNLTDLLSQELNIVDTNRQQSERIAHPLDLNDLTSSQSTTDNTIDEGYDGTSTTTSSSIPAIVHGACLTLSDHDRIHVFMSEFVTKGLLPWVEVNLKTYNEQITARRGISKFFNMPKKFFGSTKQSPTITSHSQSATNLAADSVEILLRRAGDLAFLFQDYEYAFNSYYAAKRDLSNAQAPTFYSGVLEMCCLSNFMQGPATASKSYSTSYMDEAIDTYSNVCRLPIFATRCVLMSTEILKAKDMYDSAVQQFLKLSQEDSDLRGALFLEQVSYCFLNYRSPFIRKYAFHMVIAGHRFLKAGQDHINYTLGRQNFILNRASDSINNLNSLFMSNNNNVQSAQQQIGFFKEFLTLFSQLGDSQSIDKTLPVLPLPSVENHTIKVLLGSRMQPKLGGNVSNCNDFDFDETLEVWSDLERALMANERRNSGTRSQQQIFTNRTHNQQNPIAIAKESIRVEFYVRNTLQIPLLLSEIKLLWKFSSKKKLSSSDTSTKEDDKEYTNNIQLKQNDEHDLPVETDILSDCVIFPNDSSKIELCLRPKRSGHLTILGLCYRLNILVQNTSDQTTWPDGLYGKQLFHVKGSRLNSTRKERLNVMYGTDKRLEINVLPEAPLLQVEFSQMPCTMFCGEIQSCLIHLINLSSQHSISRIKLATSHPDLITISTTNETEEDDNDEYYSYTNKSKLLCSKTLYDKTQKVLTLIPKSANKTTSKTNVLEPNAICTLKIWLKASHLVGEINTDFLFLYESDTFQQPLRYRTVKHSSLFITTSCVGLSAQTESIGLGELLLPLQIDNLTAIQNNLQITLRQISCISQKWNVNNLSPVYRNSISCGESLSLLLKCSTNKIDEKSESNDDALISNLLLSSNNNDNNYIDVSKSPVCDFYRNFLCNENFFNPSRKQSDYNRRHTSTTTPPTIQPSHTKLSLILLWQIAMSNQLGQIDVRYGLHMICPNLGDSLINDQIILEDTQQPQQPVQFSSTILTLSTQNPYVEEQRLWTSIQEKFSKAIQYEIIYKTSVKHDFNKNRTLYLPVELKLFNSSQDKLNIHIQLSRSSLELDPLLSSCCLWCGITDQIIEINASQTLNVQLKACFFKPGFYYLGNLTLSIVVSETKSDTITTLSPHKSQQLSITNFSSILPILSSLSAIKSIPIKSNIENYFVDISAC